MNGNGTYTTPVGYTVSGTSGAGTYQWNVSYNGDAGNSAVSESGSVAAQVKVKAVPAVYYLYATFKGIDVGATVSLSGSYNPTGTLTFTLWDQFYLDQLCTVTVTVSGNKDFQK